jgi:hypothetical protein
VNIVQLINNYTFFTSCSEQNDVNFFFKSDIRVVNREKKIIYDEGLILMKNPHLILNKTDVY